MPRRNAPPHPGQGPLIAASMPAGSSVTKLRPQPSHSIRPGIGALPPYPARLPRKRRRARPAGLVHAANAGVSGVAEVGCQRRVGDARVAEGGPCLLSTYRRARSPGSAWLRVCTSNTAWSFQMDASHPTPDASGSTNEHGMLSAISNEMVRIYKDQFGRGPTKTRTQWAGPDVLVVTLEKTLTPAEHSLCRLGEHARLRSLRQLFQYAESRASASRSSGSRAARCGGSSAASTRSRTSPRRCSSCTPSATTARRARRRTSTSASRRTAARRRTRCGATSIVAVTSTDRVGFVGLGIMGSRQAANLARAGTSSRSTTARGRPRRRGSPSTAAPSPRRRPTSAQRATSSSRWSSTASRCERRCSARRGRRGRRAGRPLRRHVDDRSGADAARSARKLAGARPADDRRARDGVLAEGAGGHADDHGRWRRRRLRPRGAAPARHGASSSCTSAKASARARC